MAATVNSWQENLRHRYARTSDAVTASPVQVLLVSKEVVAANADRISVTLQNCGTEPCIFRLGGTVSTAAYSFVLSDGTAARDGLGASITIENYTGAITGICEANDTTISVLEIAV